jgi:lysophospholipase L1-like esterase
VNPLSLSLVAAQGIWLRATLDLCAPAAGPTSGSVPVGSGPPVRVAVLGESTAAGCGVATHDEGFPGGFARELAARTGRPVAWEVVGQHGATGRRIRYRLVPRLSRDLTVAVLMAGGNDVLSRRPPGQWRDDLSAIVDELADRAGRVVVTGTPPFADFPSLPRTLARYLVARADAVDEVSRQVCAHRPTATWIGSAELPPVEPDFFGPDRFHPSAVGYRRWAAAVAQRIAPLIMPAPEPEVSR